MTKFPRLLCAVLCAALLSGCGASAANEAETVQTSQPSFPVETAAPEEPTAALTQPPTVPEETAEALPVPPETVEAETAPPEAGMPVLALPQVSDEPCDFYDDAAIMGDSISYSLMVHNARTKDLGGALFLVRGSLGIHNTLNKQLSVTYRGQPMTPWDALAASGVSKVFLMMGMNDIGYYSIDDTMEQWGVFLENIRAACPELQIYIQSLTPMWNGAQQTLLNNANIDLYNQRLRAFAEENGCAFVNIAPYFKNADNGLAAKYAGDLYVHMNEEGTAAWAAVLKAYGEGIPLAGEETLKEKEDLQ